MYQVVFLRPATTFQPFLFGYGFRYGVEIFIVNNDGAIIPRGETCGVFFAFMLIHASRQVGGDTRV